MLNLHFDDLLAPDTFDERQKMREKYPLLCLFKHLSLFYYVCKIRYWMEILLPSLIYILELVLSILSIRCRIEIS